MPRYSHQYLIALTVENSDADHEKVTEQELLDGLTRRMKDIFRHDGIEAFQHNDTAEV